MTQILRQNRAEILFIQSICEILFFEESQLKSQQPIDILYKKFLENLFL